MRNLRSFLPTLIGSLILIYALLVLLACQVSVDVPSDAGNSFLQPAETQNVDTSIDWYELYFTQPDNPNSKTLRGGPDRQLADAIRAARVTVDVAALQLNLWSLRDALLDAHQRGVKVRLVTESEYIDEKEVQELIQAGIPVIGDRREGLMHNKFAIIDRYQVWTGSMNLTVNGAYRNDNNLIAIRSSELAQDYTTEFEEMFADDHFGPGSPANTPYPIINLGSNIIEVYFSPDDGVGARLLELIDSADESIYFLAYSFTSDDLADSILARAQDGVTVSGVFDEGQAYSNTGGEFERLSNTDLDVRLDGNPDKMHHKVIIIDEEIVVLGSYNFSQSAETSNDENVLIIHQPELAARFLSEFKRIMAIAHL